MDSVETQQLNLGENLDIPPVSDECPNTPMVSIPSSAIPRPLNLRMLYDMWQPMGIRVTVRLPYVADDSHALFCIRVNPYIPHLADRIENPVMNFANLFPVRHDVSTWDATVSGVNLKTSAVSISQYGMPPHFSVISQCFRRWKGAIHYRMRTVSNFGTQGNIVVGVIKGVPIECGYINPFMSSFPIARSDITLSELMSNSHVNMDVSMYRHVEICAPFCYPVDWFDQCARNEFGSYRKLQPLVSTTGAYNDYSYALGDNYIMVCARGIIADPSQNNQITFELDYKPGVDFEFSEPTLPPSSWWQSKYDLTVKTDEYSNIAQNPILPTLTVDANDVPTTGVYTDGLTKLSRSALNKPAVSSRMAPVVAVVSSTPAPAATPKTIISGKLQTPQEATAEKAVADKAYYDQLVAYYKRIGSKTPEEDARVAMRARDNV